MSASMSTLRSTADTSFAPHPLNEGVTPQAARIAEGARSASSAQILAAADAPFAPGARAYALALAKVQLFDPGADAVVELPQIPEDVDDLNFIRAAVFEVLVVVGGEDAEDWMSLLGLLLLVRGDRFVEVCDGRL